MNLEFIWIDFQWSEWKKRKLQGRKRTERRREEGNGTCFPILWSLWSEMWTYHNCLFRKNGKTGETASSANKCLLFNLEDLSLIPKLVFQKQEDYGAYWSTTPKSESPMSYCSKLSKWISPEEGNMKLTSGLHTHKYCSHPHCSIPVYASGSQSWGVVITGNQGWIFWQIVGVHLW